MSGCGRLSYPQPEIRPRHIEVNDGLVALQRAVDEARADVRRLHERLRSPEV